MKNLRYDDDNDEMQQFSPPNNVNYQDEDIKNNNAAVLNNI